MFNTCNWCGRNKGPSHDKYTHCPLSQARVKRREMLAEAGDHKAAHADKRQAVLAAVVSMDDADELRRLSGSADWEVRWAVARNPHTTADVVDRLRVDDPKELVRHSAHMHPRAWLVRWDRAVGSGDGDVWQDPDAVAVMLLDTREVLRFDEINDRRRFPHLTSLEAKYVSLDDLFCLGPDALQHVMGDLEHTYKRV